MNRLKYLEAARIQRVAAQWRHKSKAIDLFCRLGRVNSETHRVALLVGIAQLKARVPRGRGYCLANAQLDAMTEHLKADK